MLIEILFVAKINHMMSKNEHEIYKIIFFGYLIGKKKVKSRPNFNRTKKSRLKKKSAESD